jgi:hypothetical protein
MRNRGARPAVIDVFLSLVDAMPSRPQRKPNSHLQDLADFRVSLWKALAKNAKNLTGPQVVEALRKISDDIYHAGIDSAYVMTKVRDPQNLADARDLTWLSVLNVKLLHLRQSKSPPKQKQA